jgi:hypothetical protein
VARPPEVAILGKPQRKLPGNFLDMPLLSSQHNHGSTTNSEKATRQVTFGNLGPGKMVQRVNKNRDLELQLQYTNYKNGLQQIAQKIGDVEQEAEEHSS